MPDEPQGGGTIPSHVPYLPADGAGNPSLVGRIGLRTKQDELSLGYLLDLVEEALTPKCDFTFTEMREQILIDAPPQAVPGWAGSAGVAELRRFHQLSDWRSVRL
ncbi:hypothetical protein [Pseudonocardia sp. H11422]|uniref:hypothetical protein n=1 Tax=Pseudonocardia sp. H11422 TaxID=2835866 RepID=UPI00202824E7|nr:hypothetical protein [Pseudonocardia sp. H11422]